MTMKMRTTQRKLLFTVFVLKLYLSVFGKYLGKYCVIYIVVESREQCASQLVFVYRPLGLMSHNIGNEIVWLVDNFVPLTLLFVFKTFLFYG